MTLAITPTSIAEQLSVSVTTVQRWIRDGSLRAINVQVGKHRPTYRIPLTSYVTFLRTRGMDEAEISRIIPAGLRRPVSPSN